METQESIEQQIDFLLEKEKEEIVEEILEKNKPIVNETVKKDKEAKKTKTDLIIEFMDLQEKGGKILYKEHQLKRQTKQEILKHLAEYANDVLINKEPSSVQSSESHIGDPAKVESTPAVQNGALDPNQMNMIAEGLFNMNLALVSTLETSSVYFKDKTGDIALLANWSEKVVNKRQQFMEVFKQIYAKHRLEMDKYMSPVVLYGVLMTQSAAEAVYSNVQEKKKRSETK